MGRGGTPGKKKQPPEAQNEPRLTINIASSIKRCLEAKTELAKKEAELAKREIERDCQCKECSNTTTIELAKKEVEMAKRDVERYCLKKNKSEPVQIEKKKKVEQDLVDIVESLITKNPGEWSPGDLALYLGVKIEDMFDLFNENEYLKKDVFWMKSREGKRNA